ncbi:Uncharacterised protein [Starkeya nomas]|uniref:Uncharacterized protein n=2 Tax=Xanthobacteraceae TaxID=335928 RepID=A0A5S9NAH5_9HYPH|nr:MULTISPECIES: hypothetical protein [Xanthobacteraceae]TSJ60888.1 hypothetical protein FO470_15110 [Ancylobacter moscoviensis]CAA0086485.1 Uncharacterised protein [Starkeya nomas]
MDQQQAAFELLRLTLERHPEATATPDATIDLYRTCLAAVAGAPPLSGSRKPVRLETICPSCGGRVEIEFTP